MGAPNFRLSKKAQEYVVIASQCSHWRGNPFPSSPRLPLWGSCHKVTERVTTPSPPLRCTSPIGRGKALIRLALAGNARATLTVWSNCHWQLLDFDSLRGAPPQRGRLRERIVTGGSRTSPRPPHNSMRCAVASGVTSPPPPVRHPPVWSYRESGQNTPGTSRPRPD